MAIAANMDAWPLHGPDVPSRRRGSPEKMRKQKRFSSFFFYFLPPSYILKGMHTVNSVGELMAAVDDKAIDDIVLSPGLYTLDRTLDLKRPVTVRANSPGSAVLHGNRSVRVIHVAEGTAGVWLIGLNITGGVADDRTSGGPGNRGAGGGVYIGGGSTVELRECNVYDNRAYDGAGVYLLHVCEVTMTDVSITFNSGQYGAGLRIFDDGAVPVSSNKACQRATTLTRCRVRNNHAMGLGGGVYQFGGVLAFDHSLLDSNVAQVQGGGLCLSDGIASLSDSTVEGNQAGGGGGLRVGGGTLTVQRSRIVRNVASAGPGGGLYVEATAGQFHRAKWAAIRLAGGPTSCLCTSTLPALRYPPHRLPHAPPAFSVGVALVPLIVFLSTLHILPSSAMRLPPSTWQGPPLSTTAASTARRLILRRPVRRDD